MANPTSDEQTPLLAPSNSSSNHNHNHDPPPSLHEDEPPNSNLQKFRDAIGINTTIHSEDGDIESARRGAQGVYKQIIGLQKWRARQYTLVETIYYLSLGAQVIIGATLASLAPLVKIHTMAITILGILNASLAGILALLKGQGLPDRLRKDEFEMRKVQDFIEETEVKLVISGDGFTRKRLEELVAEVFDKYNTARDTAEMNKPMSYAHQSETNIHGMDGAGGSHGVKKNLVVRKENGDVKGKGKYIID